MSIARAVETTATIDTPHSLRLDEPLPHAGGRVRVIVLLRDEECGEYDDSEINEATWLQAGTANPAFDFLAHPAEDIYTWEDGKPSSFRNVANCL